MCPAVPELAHKWKHLERIADCMPSQLHGAKVGLLIGSNCPKALEPIDIVARENGGPYAINTFCWMGDSRTFEFDQERPSNS